MKYYRCLLITILVLSANAHASEPKIEIIEQFDNLRMVAFISMEDIKGNPEWDPSISEPPLTVSGAIQAVKAFIKVSVSINEIEIRQVPRHKKQWHYLIKTTNDSIKSKYSIYVVLMHGTVIRAITQPDGYQ